MAITINIKDLLHRTIVESSRIEFKAGFNPDPIIRTICAYANDIENIGCGYIVVGVEEKDGVPVLPPKGLEKKAVDSYMKTLREYCHFIQPLIEPEVQPMECDGKVVLVIQVRSGMSRPYKAPRQVTSGEKVWKYFIRKFSSTVEASRDEEKELFYISCDTPFDDRPNLLAEVTDLSRELMKEHLEDINSTMPGYDNMSRLELAENLALVSGPPEDLRPLNVGILMFSENPQKFFRYARLEIADIPDPTGEGMVDKTFVGPIQRQLKDALAYIQNYIIAEKINKEADSPYPRRVYNYPPVVVQEILANAVYHRSYQIQEPITVTITPEGMEITSFPGFDRSIADEAIVRKEIRTRVYRNRRIGDFLKELRLIEGRNTGFPKSMKALRDNGSGELKFIQDPQRQYLSVFIPVHPLFLKKTNAKKDLYRQRILDTLKDEPMTLSELSREMGYKGISARLRDNVAELENMGRLEKKLDDDKSIKFSVRYEF